MNKLTMLVSDGVIAAGTLVVPSRKLYVYLTDRIGNYRELEPYLKLWKSVPCKNGVLEIVVIEQDAESFDVPKIPKITAGRANGLALNIIIVLVGVDLATFEAVYDFLRIIYFGSNPLAPFLFANCKSRSTAPEWVNN